MTAIYARQSLDKKDSISIDMQIELCKKEFGGGEPYIVYQDKGFSGKNTDRPQFTKMMAAAEQKEIQRIVVYRLDRISRSITDFANIIDTLEKYNIDFISANEKFDTSTPMGRAMLYIIMVFAQLERETIAERIKDNYYSRGKGGVWLGGPAPIGYEIAKKIVNGKKIAALQETETIEIIKAIYDEYAHTSQSLGAIARKYQDLTGEMWNNIKLSRILHNPTYVLADMDIYNYYVGQRCILVNDPAEFDGTRGCILYGKRSRSLNKYRNLEEHVLALGQHKGVIPSATWLKCQAKLDGNIQIKNTGKGKHTWLSGLVKCGYCGYGMNVKIYKDTKYFTCTGRYVQKGGCADKLETIYVDALERGVEDEIKLFVSKYDHEAIKRKNHALSVEANSLKLELHTIETQINNLLDNMANANNVLTSYVNNRITELDMSRKDIQNKINAINMQETVLDLPDISNWAELSMEDKKSISQKLILRINVFNDKIEIDWKY